MLTDITLKHDACTQMESTMRSTLALTRSPQAMTDIAPKQESTCIAIHEESTGMHALKWNLQCGQRLHSRGVYKQ